jgi:nucleoside-diphosphate-sugar epimerase
MRALITGGSGFIGTNLIADMIERRFDVLNVDWNEPLNKDQKSFWVNCDIMDFDKLQSIFDRYQPEIVVHLAARTDTDIYDINGDRSEYIQNIDGTANIIKCIENTASIHRVIITSSMFVCEAGHMPLHDTDYKPFTLYGVSKVLTEKLTRESNMHCTWTIIRPQTIWGPWCVRYRDTMFKVMRKGLYFHPSKPGVRRSLGYVGNVVWQIQQLLARPAEQVHAKTFYVGDQTVNLLDWVNEVSRQFTGKPARLLPTTVVKAIAVIGDVLKSLRMKFPLTSTRFNSMTQDYLTEIEKTYDLLGHPPFQQHEGIRRFISWYHDESFNISLASSKNLRVNTAGVTQTQIA